MSEPEGPAADGPARLANEPEVSVRGYREKDLEVVRELFIRVNRELAPEHMRDAFRAYIERSIDEEIGRIPDYYGTRDGGFWVATRAGELGGMFGLERAGLDAVELRRMYLAPGWRGRGLGRRLLDYAERAAARRGFRRMSLSTSEIQKTALSLYRTHGFELVREEVAEGASNKTVGGGIRRFHFEKRLGASAPVCSEDDGWFSSARFLGKGTTCRRSPP